MIKDQEFEKKKIDILLHAWGDFSKQVESVSNRENRISLSFVTFCGTILIYLRTLDIGVFKVVIWYFIIGIILALIAAIKFLYDNNKRLKWLCRCLVNIQISLGMYENGVFDFFKPSVLNEGLFDPKGKLWGIKGKYLNFRSHVVLILLFGAATVFFIYTKFYEASV